MKKRYIIKKKRIDSNGDSIFLKEANEIEFQTANKTEAIEKIEKLEIDAYRKNFLLLGDFIAKDGYVKSQERYDQLMKSLSEKFGITKEKIMSGNGLYELLTDKVIRYMLSVLKLDFYQFEQENDVLYVYEPTLNPAIIIDALEGVELLKQKNRGKTYFDTPEEAINQMAKVGCYHISKSFCLSGELNELSDSPSQLEELINTHEHIKYEDGMLTLRRCEPFEIIAVNKILIDKPILISKSEIKK